MDLMLPQALQPFGDPGPGSAGERVPDDTELRTVTCPDSDTRARLPGPAPARPWTGPYARPHERRLERHPSMASAGSWAPRPSSASRCRGIRTRTPWSPARGWSTPTRPPPSRHAGRAGTSRRSHRSATPGVRHVAGGGRPQPAHRRGPRPGECDPHQRGPPLRRPRAPGVLHP